jgi:hypothetical protein
MGIISSRAILWQIGEHSESQRHFRGKFKPIPTSDRLVCDELCEEIQHLVPNKKSKARDSLSLIQVPLKGVQQEDVRPVLQIKKD